MMIYLPLLTGFIQEITPSSKHIVCVVSALTVRSCSKCQNWSGVHSVPFILRIVQLSVPLEAMSRARWSLKLLGRRVEVSGAVGQAIS